eukprot:CAMPEP_0171088816 /NCGR_PEP_ID=MMETSP0766_2-20121228/21004_1 /TAXON_ID=439317 /ORGANISM="Gambierdiscus australes, Strain CAWD 149" /LENGTH=160 /DNA_ID=CAMNT_0011546631 /DNA_START=49 /DNA_END=532 /DNA_ORIENTATION=-
MARSAPDRLSASSTFGALALNPHGRVPTRLLHACLWLEALHLRGVERATVAPECQVEDVALPRLQVPLVAAATSVIQLVDDEVHRRLTAEEVEVNTPRHCGQQSPVDHIHEAGDAPEGKRVDLARLQPQAGEAPHKFSPAASTENPEVLEVPNVRFLTWI